jgi:hypothetical protein
MKIHRLIPWGIVLSLTACSIFSTVPTTTHEPPRSPEADETPTTQEPTPTSAPPAATEPTIPVHSTPISYLHLRFEYTSTSDWTTLEFTSTEHILTARIVSFIGDPQQPFAGVQGISLGQNIAGPEQAEIVGLVVDLLLAPEALDETLAFSLRKGNWNGSYVRISHVVDEVVNEIWTVTHDGVIPGTAGRNSLLVSVDLSTQGQLALETAEIQYLEMPRMVWAFYYPWYRLNDWSSEILVDRPSIPYASDDPDAIARHIEQAQEAGIDGFISSWWGPDSDTDQNLVPLLDLAQERGFAVTIYFETLRGDGPQPKHVIIRWLRYLLTTHTDHPAFFKINGVPLVVFWASGAVPLETWGEIFETLRGEGLDLFTFGIGYSSANFEVFDGIHEYGVFLDDDLLRTFQDVSRVTRFYPLLTGDGEPRMWAATVQPGYDDRLIPGREGLFRDRDNGDFYRSTFDAALASQPDWIFVSTWNEWWEHTHIESSENFGELYLQITRSYSDQWKGQ